MKRNLIQIGLAAVIIIAFGFVVKQLQPKQYGGFERILVDAEANKVFTMYAKAGEITEFPVASPYSKGRNAYPALKCMKCGAILAYDEPKLVIDAEGKTIVSPGIPICPACGSEGVTVVELPEGQKTMDVSGPVQIVKPGTPVSPSE